MPCAEDAERRPVKLARAPGSLAACRSIPLPLPQRFLWRPVPAPASQPVELMTPTIDEVSKQERAPDHSSPQDQASDAQEPQEHQALTQMLTRAATALGANTLAVLILDTRSLDVLHCRTFAGELLSLPAPLPCALEVRLVLECGPSPLPERNPLARFFASTIAPSSLSFLVVPCRLRHCGIALVFGFETPQPAACSVPAHLADHLTLASVTAWSLHEITRLRAELRRANQSFAGRKLVDRAKAFLQSQRGLNEQEAYEYLRRLSRQRRIPLSKLAADLLGAPH